MKKVALVLVAAVAVLVVVISMRPDTFRVERTATVTAPPDIAFAMVNDFHQWAGWSPWEKLDPNMKKTYEGKTGAVGSSYFWTGNDKVGEGRMTITESNPTQKVVIKLEFIKPFAATNTTTFSFVPQGETTKVAWVMDGNSNFMTKAFSLFKDMDSMIGADFERGLSQMKEIAENESRKRSAAAVAAQAAAAAAPQAEAAPAPATPEAAAAAPVPPTTAK